MGLLDLFRVDAPAAAECYVCAARAGRQADGERCDGCTAAVAAAAYAQAEPLWTEAGELNDWFGSYRLAAIDPVRGGSATPTAPALRPVTA